MPVVEFDDGAVQEGEQTVTFAETRRPAPRNPILEKNVFEQLQRNEFVETRPQVLHFGGFQVHKQHSARLKVLNISTTSARVTIIGPSTPCFQISYDKKGLLAPGMSEDLVVKFEPHEWRYYYDTIKIFCGDQSDNILVPIHAYPSVNQLKIPKVVDFGSVAIGTTRTKVIPLTCSVPVQFEFEVTITESHPDVDVTPTRGIIPADGTVNIVLTYVPTTYGTASAKLCLNISQFDFVPMTVSIVGNSLPDLLNTEVLNSSHADLIAATKQKLQDKMVSKALSLRSKRLRGPLETRSPRLVMDPPERVVNGVKVPTRSDQQATNFVLNQTAGKLPLKDLFAFICKHREASERRRLRAEAARVGQADNIEGEDEDEDDVQALELRFDLKYRDVAKYDKDKELNSRIAIGEEPRSQEELDGFLAARKLHHERLLNNALSEDLKRFETVKYPEANIGIPAAYVHKLHPDWNETNNDTFGTRLKLIDRFVRAGSKFLMRMRVRKAVDALRAAIKAAGAIPGDPVSCRAWIDSENRAHAAGGNTKSRAVGSTAGGDPSAASGKGLDIEIVRIPLDLVLASQIPTTRKSNGTESKGPIEVTSLGNFTNFPRMSLNPRLDYKVLGYKERHTLPPPAAYSRPNEGNLRREMLSAALEENLCRGPCGDPLDGAEVPMTMPMFCLKGPEPDPIQSLSLFVPSPLVRTYVRLPTFTECDPEFQLSQPPPVAEFEAAATKTTPWLPQNLMSLEAAPPWLSVWRRTRQIQDPFMHFDPFPASFSEAGGSQGPRIGFDPGGERLSFMPVGGFARDILSDTDDDDAKNMEDYEQTKPPPLEVYEAALKSLDAPVDSRRWKLAREAEARLEKGCQERNSACRERLRNLNSLLSPAAKLYLG